MFMNKWFYSLHTRIIIMTALVVSAVLVLFSFINLRLLEENSRKNIEDGIVLLVRKWMPALKIRKG